MVAFGCGMRGILQEAVKERSKRLSAPLFVSPSADHFTRLYMYKYSTGNANGRLPCQQRVVLGATKHLAIYLTIPTPY